MTRPDEPMRFNDEGTYLDPKYTHVERLPPDAPAPEPVSHQGCTPETEAIYERAFIRLMAAWSKGDTEFPEFTADETRELERHRDGLTSFTVPMGMDPTITGGRRP